MSGFAGAIVPRGCEPPALGGSEVGTAFRDPAGSSAKYKKAGHHLNAAHLARLLASPGERADPPAILGLDQTAESARLRRIDRDPDHRRSQPPEARRHSFAVFGSHC